MPDALHYTTQYELLRSQVIGAGNADRGNTTSQPRRGIGLALLLTEGIPAWVRAVEAVLRASPALRTAASPNPSPHQGSPQCSDAPVWLSSVPRHEVTTLLVSLVLSTRPLARYESLREGCR